MMQPDHEAKACTQCGWPAVEAAGAFCENCGAERSEVGEISATSSPEVGSERLESDSSAAEEEGGGLPSIGTCETVRVVHNSQAQESIVFSELGDVEEAEKGSDAPPLQVEDDPSPRRQSWFARLRQDVNEEDSTTKTAGRLSQCDALDISYNIGRIFLENATVPFEFKIRPHAAQIENVYVAIKARDIPLIMEEIDEYVEAGECYCIYLPFTAPAGMFGELPFHIYVGISTADKPGELQWFKTSKVHRIYKAREKAQRVINELKIELRADIREGNASDGIVQRIDGLEALKPREHDPAQELQHISLPAVWHTLSLQKCRAPAKHLKENRAVRPSSVPPAQAITERLTLQLKDGRLVHLLNDSVMVMGRSRECAIIVRKFKEDGQMDRDKSLHLSGRQCRLMLEDRSFSVADGGFSPQTSSLSPSGAGTAVNGQNLQPLGIKPCLSTRSSLALGAAIGMELGGPVHFDVEPIFCEPSQRAECVLFSPPCKLDTIISLVLRRRDLDQELYVAIPRCCPMKRVDARFGELMIWREQDAFAWRLHNDAGWLTPGTDLRIDGHRIRVEPYRQYGL